MNPEEWTFRVNRLILEMRKKKRWGSDVQTSILKILDLLELVVPSCYETLIHIYQLRNRKSVFQRIRENISSLLKEERALVSDDQQV